MFQSNQVRFLEDRVQFIENRLVKSEYLYKALNSIAIEKGTDVKRPKISIAFGFGLLVTSYAIYDAAGFDPTSLNRSIIYAIVAMFFFAVLGCYAIYSALPIHPIVRVRLKDSSKSFEIKPLIKGSSYQDFIGFLQTKVDRNRFSQATDINL